MGKKKELVGSNANSRNWKGLAISVLVIVIVFTLIIIAVILKRPPPKDNLDFKALTLDDIIHKNYEPKRFNGIWLNSRQFAYLTDNSNIMLYDCEYLNQTLILPNSTINPLVGNNFKIFMGSDTSIVLFAFEIKSVYRHSYTAKYILYNKDSRMQYHITPSDLDDEANLQNSVISPNSKRVVFVYKNDIYLSENFFDSQNSKTTRQITNDGLENTIYNGVTDWLYEEEILLQTNAIWWAPDSSRFAYIKFNDSLVEYYYFPIYDGSAYGGLNKVRYPKPDTRNPKVTIYVYDVTTKANIELTIPKVFINADFYIQNVKWLTGDTLLVVYLNRKQNNAYTVVYNALDGQNKIPTKQYPIGIDTDAWIVSSGLHVSVKNNYYFQIWPSNGYKNIHLFDVTKNSDVQVITYHKFDVTDILSVNDNRDEIYYLATNGDPKQRHLFRKKYLDSNSKAECLTCNETEIIPPVIKPSENSALLTDSQSCLYYSASFSTNGDYYALECLGERIPITYIKKVDEKKIKLKDQEGTQESKNIFERNDELKQALHKKLLPRKSYLRVYFDNDTNSCKI